MAERLQLGAGTVPVHCQDFSDADVERYINGFEMRRADECWPWVRGCFPQGYGSFWFRGKSHHASRISWLLNNADIPENGCVLHKCNNSSCVNPSHLKIGDAAQNNRDTQLAGHTWKPRGELHPQHKLTAEQVRSIREIAATQIYSQRELAPMFGCARNTISRILTGATWRYT